MKISETDRKRCGNKSHTQTGRRFPVGDKRLTVKQISELTGKGISTVGAALHKETADHFIKRVGRVKP